MPRYEFSEGTSSKFWEITVSGKERREAMVASVARSIKRVNRDDPSAK